MNTPTPPDEPQTPSPAPAPAISDFVVPRHYDGLDKNAPASKELGASGLPTPASCGIHDNAEKLARYTALFEVAEKLHKPAAATHTLRDLMKQNPAETRAVAEAWAYLEAAIKPT